MGALMASGRPWQKMRLGKYDAALDGSLLSTTAAQNSSNFMRNKAVVSRRFSYFTLGLSDELENNQFRNDSVGTLGPGSYAYNEWEGFIQSPDSAKAMFLGGRACP